MHAYEQVASKRVKLSSRVPNNHELITQERGNDKMYNLFIL